MPVVINGSGTVTGISVGGLPDGIVDADMLASGVGGKILQVKSTIKTDTFSTTSSSFVDVTNMSIDIDPIAASSKILVLVETNSSTSSGNNAIFRLVRGSTAIALGDAAGSRTQGTFQQRVNDGNASLNGSIKFLDAPTYNVGDTLTYKLQALVQGGGLDINRTATNTDGAAYGRTVSSITVMEVAT